MKTYCELSLTKEKQPNEGVICVTLVHIVLDLPITPFKGMQIVLPYPKSWDGICGGICGVVDNVCVVKQFVCVKLKVPNSIFDEDSISELVAIGYALDDPEIIEAWNSMGR